MARYGAKFEANTGVFPVAVFTSVSFLGKHWLEQLMDQKSVLDPTDPLTQHSPFIIQAKLSVFENPNTLVSLAPPSRD